MRVDDLGFEREWWWRWEKKKGEEKKEEERKKESSITFTFIIQPTRHPIPKQHGLNPRTPLSRASLWMVWIHGHLSLCSSPTCIPIGRNVRHWPFQWCEDAPCNPQPAHVGGLSQCASSFLALHSFCTSDSCLESSLGKRTFAYAHTRWDTLWCVWVQVASSFLIRNEDAQQWTRCASSPCTGGECVRAFLPLLAIIEMVGSQDSACLHRSIVISLAIP